MTQRIAALPHWQRDWLIKPGESVVSIPARQLISYYNDGAGATTRCLVCEAYFYNNHGPLKHEPGCLVGQAFANAALTELRETTPEE